MHAHTCKHHLFNAIYRLFMTAFAEHPKQFSSVLQALDHLLSCLHRDPVDSAIVPNFSFLDQLTFLEIFPFAKQAHLL